MPEKVPSGRFDGKQGNATSERRRTKAFFARCRKAGLNVGSAFVEVWKPSSASFLMALRRCHPEGDRNLIELVDPLKEMVGQGIQLVPFGSIEEREVTFVGGKIEVLFVDFQAQVVVQSPLFRAKSAEGHGHEEQKIMLFGAHFSVRRSPLRSDARTRPDDTPSCCVRR